MTWGCIGFDGGSRDKSSEPSCPPARKNGGVKINADTELAYAA